MKQSVFELLGLPQAFGNVVLVLALISLLAPYLSGLDFGIFKIPNLPEGSHRRWQIFGPVVFLAVVFLFLPLWSKVDAKVQLGDGGDGGSKTDSEAVIIPAPDENTRIWDAAADFDSINRGGVWEAGWMASPRGTFHRYEDRFSQEVFISWSDKTVRRMDTPEVRKNIGQEVLLSVQPGQVALHPGCGGDQLSHRNEYTVLRWSAPQQGTYQVYAEFLAGDAGVTEIGDKTGDTNAFIIKTGSGGGLLFQTHTTETNPRFSERVRMSQGDALDFIVGASDDGCFSDTTPVTVRIFRRR